MMQIKYKFILLFSLILISYNIKGQIVADNNTVTLKTEYTGTTDIDSIYIFKDLAVGVLRALEPSGVASPTYIWQHLNAGTWEDVISGTLNEITKLHEGAYKLIVRDGATEVASYRCWVMQPQLLTLKADTIESTCYSLNLKSDVTYKPLSYTDIVNGSVIQIPYDIKYEWTITPSEESKKITEPNPVVDAPVEKTNYKLIANAFNAASEVSSEIEVEPKAVKADFNFDVYDREYENELKETEEFKELTQFKGSSEITITLNNKSKGDITNYTWQLIDDKGEIITQDIGVNPPEFEVTLPGIYNIVLEVQNIQFGCSDSFKSGNIEANKMSVEAPNVFTPDGDGINDFFEVTYKSVDKFKMTIINRWGRKVFETTNPGEGWNGKIGGRKASEGVYFYYIDAKDFTGKEHIELKGPVHLLRGE